MRKLEIIGYVSKYSHVFHPGKGKLHALVGNRVHCIIIDDFNLLGGCGHDGHKGNFPVPPRQDRLSRREEPHLNRCPRASRHSELESRN